MDVLNRWQTKLRKVGTSLVVTIPWQLRQELNLKPGDPLVTYQIDGVYLVLPLAFLGTIGEHPLIKHLRQYQPQIPH